ncbi:NAD(P)-dependent oxidoreductase [Massilia varians]|uniref:dTDP-4-dehydrorhamnose reductase n=1 Tax=Massilia varians TaxID=457921 RepID=A0ABN6TEJ2_9BURK|nr:SDR family oxidoreductase [Massilia varians]BDT60632.1 NAD(P)-dependent oxidoreductase [Massilia varians]
MNDMPVQVLILGASGMLGNAMLRLFASSEGFNAYGTVRSQNALAMLPEPVRSNVIDGVDVENTDSMVAVLDRVRPDIVINCIGLVKQLTQADDPLQAIPINALLPHRLARLCTLVNARFVHMSTDCVFSGAKGMYTEDDASDAYDLYGRSKFLGEVDYPHAITLRTSIIGHELDRHTSLIGWFLRQKGKVCGFDRAIFSGLPTIEVARVIRDFVIPHRELQGVYNLSAEPINKFDLLALVAEVYGKQINIVRDSSLVIDRSLDSTRFRQATGFVPPSWPELVRLMHNFK